MMRYAGAAVLACALAAATQAVEAKTVKITAIGAPPPIVTNVRVVREYVIPEVNRRIEASGQDFKIEWREAWAQSLANFNETFEAVENNIAQFGMIISGFEESKLPLEQYTAMVPFHGLEGAKLDAIDQAIRAKVPEMSQAYLRHNQVFLSAAASDTFGLLTKFPVRKFEDLEGKKIGTTGSWGHMLRGTKAVAVTSSMADAYTNIRNGVYDGYISAVSLSFPYKIDEAAPNYTVVNFGGIVSSSLTVNKATWDEFPEFARTIFREVARGWSDRYVRITTESGKNFVGLMEKRGAKFAPLAAAERRKWASAMPNVPKEWADNLDKRGQPGTKLLAAFMDALRGSGAEVVRNWDRE